MTRQTPQSDNPLAGPCRARPGELLGLPAGLLAPGLEQPLRDDTVPAYRAPATPARHALDNRQAVASPGPAAPRAGNRPGVPHDRFSRLPAGLDDQNDRPPCNA